MTFSLQFKYGGKRFDNAHLGINQFALDALTPMENLGPVVNKIFKDILDSVADAMKQRHSGPWSPGRRGAVGERSGRLAKRSGDMISSIERSVKTKQTGKDSVTGEIGGNISARTHERGATIRPRKAKFLAIPLPPALDARGVPLKMKPRDWPNLFVIKSRKGNLLLVRKVGGNIQPMYFLTKGPVKIPKRLGLQKTLDAAGPVFVDRLFDEVVRKINENLK